MTDGDPNPTSCDALPTLPEGLEDELNEIYFDTSGAAQERGLAALRAAHPEHHEALTERIRHLQSADRILSSVGMHGDPGVPDHLGPYRILREIGQGGFGIVYLASQEQPIQREVALKLLLPGVTHTRTLERFEAERNVLAMMSHPNIAHVIDAGTAGRNQPYFVMEYVDGLPITTFADQQRLGIGTRLQLFLQVCAGVQHAHQKGVLHRDIKPSNTLVALRDGEPVPKIIDFGIAKALHDELSLIESQTEFGGVVGTPEYMSPEQAGGLPVDVRTDIYALGVLLYELMTGRLPFQSTELRGAGLAEMARVIRESTPMRASEALRHDAESTERAARNRGVESSQLYSGIRGDLDSILQKSLEKDPDDRYGSVSELAAEVRRFLANEPVLARQQSFVYVARKFVRRHRIGVAAASLGVALLVIAFVGAVWGVFEIDRARQQAIERQAHAEFHSYAANIAAAKAALDTLDVRSLRRRLQATTERFRHWEWRFLAARSEESTAILEVGGEIRDLVTAGSTVVTSASDGTLSGWNLADSKSVFTVPGTGVPRRLAIHPNGRKFAAAVQDGAIEIFDVQTGRLERELPPAAGVWSVAFSPNGSELAYGCRDGKVRVFDLEAGRVETVLHCHTGDVLCMAFDRTGDRLLTGGLDRRVVLTELSSRRRIRRFEQHADIVRCVAFHPDREAIFSLARDGIIRVSDVATGKVERTFEMTVLANEFLLDAEAKLLIAVGGWRGDSRIRSWNFETGAEVATYLGHTDGVMALGRSDEPGRFVTGGFDGTLRSWLPRPRAATRQIDVGSTSFGLALHSASGRVALGNLRGALSCWDATSLELQFTVHAPSGIRELAFDVEGRRLLAAGSDGRLHVHDARTGRLIRTAPRSVPTAHHLAIDPTGAHVALGGLQGSVAVLAAATLDRVFEVKTGSRPASVAFGPDGALAAQEEGGTVRLLEPGTWRPRWQTRLPNTTPHHLTFSPDGSLLAISGWGRTAFLDPRTGEEIAIPEASEPGFSVCFSLDGARIFKSSLDRTVRVFDRVRGVELMVLHEAGPATLCFDATRDRLFGPATGELFVWTAAR